MRIAFHAPRASWLEPGFSGDQVLVQGLLSALRERRHEVKIVSRLDASTLWQEQRPVRLLLREAAGVRRRMKAFAPEAWLVYTPSVAYPDLFGWWLDPPSYVAFGADSGRPERVPRPWRRLYVAAHRRSLRRADAVAAFRPRSLRRLRLLGVPEQRLRLLLPAVQPFQALPSRPDARRRLGLPDSPLALCVSRLARRRADGRRGKTDMVLDLLEALAGAPPELTLVLVGDGNGRSRVEAEVERLGLGSRVRMAGRVPDVRPFYAACDFFAYPYELDRPWVSVLEAQACGRPVVTMDTDSAKLTVRAGETGLLAKDLDEFRDHMALLASDRVRCEGMGRSAADYARAEHSLKSRVKQIEELLRGG